MFRHLLLGTLALLLCTGCKSENGVPTMQVSSTAFTEGNPIPKQYTGEGKDVSPDLKWSGEPGGTKSFALICDDPDAPRAQPWVHWVIYNLPASTHELTEGVPAKEELPSGARQGKNDFGKIGYNGPMPPPGKPHRYFFKLYALDTLLDSKAGATKDQLEKAMKGHILAHGQCMGTYAR
jgi:Raf kinase inhibitor-like YbhB/YbcL family protein